MWRVAEDDLFQWWTQERPKPLLLRGARQVGKSTLVKNFTQKNNISLIEINLEKQKLSELNNEKNFALSKVLREIELVSGQKITSNTVIFLDEIQEQPRAVRALRYFYEDGPQNLRVIGAGSLLEVVIERQNFSMPVGRVNYYHLYPLSFLEFIRAIGEENLWQMLADKNSLETLSLSVHEKCLELLQEYLLVGGMPEIVDDYRKNKDFPRCRSLQHSLLQSYREDIPKYAQKSGEASRVLDVFNYASAHVGEKVVFSNISKQHSSQIRNAIHLASLAHVIHPVFHNSCAGLPLEAYARKAIMKLYFLDVGLYGAAMGLEDKALFTTSARDFLFKGTLMEQFVAQHLINRPREGGQSKPYYWLRQGKAGAAEVDFVFSFEGKIYPLEVKSGSQGKMRSLWQLLADKGLSLALRSDLAYRQDFVSRVSHKITTGNQSISLQAKLINIPLYLVEQLPQILQQSRR